MTSAGLFGRKSDVVVGKTSFRKYIDISSYLGQYDEQGTEFVLFKSNIMSVIMSKRGRCKASLKKIIVQCVSLDSPSCVALS